MSEESSSAEPDGGDPPGPQVAVGSKMTNALEIIARHPISPVNLGFRVSQIALDYLGDGKFIHAPRSRETIRISSLEERSPRHGFLGARRVLADE